MKNRPWDVWWDFRWAGEELKWIVIQSDHPNYNHVDYIHRLPISECEDRGGQIDDWVETWFTPFRHDLITGRVSIHALMKELGYEKLNRVNHGRTPI
jgi:hypothetical protein